MKTLYIECNMGAAGDMLLASLAELTGDVKAVENELNSLGIPDVTYSFENCVYKKDGRYYMLSSWCTGWAPNQGKWSTATAMDGEWSALYDFGDELTYRSQPAYVLQKDGRDIYVGDRWEGDGDKYFTSTYIILDIKYDENGCPYIDWDENAAF